MRSLWLLTKKNLRLLIRSKSSALIVVFAPLLIILILGLSFNNSAQYGLNIGVVAESFNDDVDSLVTSLQEEEFKIVKYENSLDGCIEDVKLGFVHTCVLLPQSFTIDSNEQKEITFYVDPSEINLVWMIQQTIREKLNIKSQEITEDLASSILGKLSDANTKVGAEKDRIDSVKSSSSDALGSIASSSAGLSSLDLSSPPETYDTALVGAFESNFSSSLNTGLSKVQEAQDALAAANISNSHKSPISTVLNEAESNLKAASKTFNDTDDGFAAISTLVDNLKIELDGAVAKLVSASEQVSSTTTSLESSKTSLDQVVSTLNEIQLALGEVKASLDAQKVTEAGVISSPLITKIETVTPESTHLNYLFSGLIILVIMFSSLLLGTTLVMMEKHSPAYIRNFFLPVKKVIFILSIYLTNLILVLIQVVIILGISFAFLPEFLNSIPLMSLILFLAASVFTFLGMAIGYVFTSEDTAVLGSISLGSLLLFFSGMILPLEGVSSAVREATFYNPFVIAEKLVREVFIFKTGFSEVWIDLGFLFIYVVVLFLAILVLQSLLHSHLVHKYLKHHHKLHRQKDKKKKGA